jgi:hypothetical protein
LFARAPLESLHDAVVVAEAAWVDLLGSGSSGCGKPVRLVTFAAGSSVS